jgi:hypothetical protein
VSITRYKLQQTQVGRTHYTSKYHKRRAPSSITKSLFRMSEILLYLSEYLIKYIKSRVQYIEKSLGKPTRKSRIKKSLGTKQYNKRPWRLRKKTQHKRKEQILTSPSKNTFSDRRLITMRDKLIKINNTNPPISCQSTSERPEGDSEGDDYRDDYKTPSFYDQSYLIYWIMRFTYWITCQYYKRQRYDKVSIAYTTKVKDIENELGRATRFDTDSFPI